MTARPFAQIDVFAHTAGLGNPVAVVLDASGLDEAAMQRFARWTNLSETTFVLPPTDAGADYRLRIFTPGGELPFAGHPTLGSCFAWLAAGGRPRSPGRIVQQSGGTRVAIRQDGGRLAFAAPPSRHEAPAPATLAQVARALGLAPARVQRAQVLDNGPRWLTLLLDSADTVLALTPDLARLAALGQNVAVAGMHAAPSAIHLIARSSREARAFGAAAASATAAADEPRIEVRAFAPALGIAEDPITGSLNASLAQWLIGLAELPAAYVAAQGTALGREGRVHIASDADGQVWVGGDCVRVISGEVSL